MAGDATAVTDGAYTLFVADFDDTDTAWTAYQELKSLEDGATVAIDGVIVVKRDAAGSFGSATIERNWPNNWRPRSLPGTRGSWHWSPIPVR